MYMLFEIFLELPLLWQMDFLGYLMASPFIPLLWSFLWMASSMTPIVSPIVYMKNLMDAPPTCVAAILALNLYDHF